MVRLGKVRQARQGRVGHGEAWRGVSGQAWHFHAKTKRGDYVSVYKWKLNLYKIDPQAAGEYLKQLEDRDGAVIPSVLVEESQDKESLLYPCFGWDDNKAAEHYRIHQAKGVIRNIVVVYQKEEKEEPVAVRAFVHTCEADETAPKYISIETALSDEILTNRLLESAIRDLNEFRGKYKNLVELSKVFHIIDETLYDSK